MNLYTDRSLENTACAQYIRYPSRLPPTLPKPTLQVTIISVVSAGDFQAFDSAHCSINEEYFLRCRIVLIYLLVSPSLLGKKSLEK